MRINSRRHPRIDTQLLRRTQPHHNLAQATPARIKQRWYTLKTTLFAWIPAVALSAQGKAKTLRH
jgi:hypothetical protein